MRRPADMALPERSESVHEYRAALMSVFLHTLPQDDPAHRLMPSVQPLTLSEAIAWIQRLPDKLQRKARAHAAYRMAVAAFVERRQQEFEPLLVELMGAQEERRLRDTLSTITVPSPDLVFSAIYEPLARPRPTDSKDAQPPTDTKGPQDPRPPPAADERRDVGPLRNLKRRAAPAPRPLPILAPPQLSPHPPPQHDHSTLDLETLTTTVSIQAPSLRDFKELRRTLDPRNWDASPFWPESYAVELSSDGAEFQRVRVEQPLGETWSGNLFEHVEWNWNATSVSSFRNFLNISYEVSEQPEQIRFTFSLYSCEGSTLFLREARNGVDVDHGFLNVDRVNTPPGAFRIDTQKILRFSDILARHSPLEGPVGSGQILSFMAPAVVGLWMHDLLSSLYFPE